MTTTEMTTETEEAQDLDSMSRAELIALITQMRWER